MRHGPVVRMGMQLIGKKVVITGGGRGLGRAIALRFAEEGATLAICGRTNASLEALLQSLAIFSVPVIAHTADVSDVDDVERFIGDVTRHWRTIDVLVNNAGVAPARVPICESTEQEWRTTLAINVIGPFLMTRATIPHMTAGSSIINVSSRLGRGLFDRGRGVYGVSKYALEGLTRFLAEELCEKGIAVNSVAPGLVATDMSNWEGSPPESVVDAFVYLASDQANGISGRALYAPDWKSELGIT